MKRIFILVFALIFCVLSANAFSSDSVYGVYTDTKALQMKPETRDVTIDVEQFLSDLNEKTLNIDEKVQKSLIEILAKLSPKTPMDNLIGQINAIKCDMSKPEIEQNSLILNLLRDYTQNVTLSSANLSNSDKTVVKQEINNLSKEAKKYINLKNKELNVKDFLSAINDTNKKESIKNDLIVFAKLLSDRSAKITKIVNELNGLL